MFRSAKKIVALGVLGLLGCNSLLGAEFDGLEQRKEPSAAPTQTTNESTDASGSAVDADAAPPRSDNGASSSSGAVDGSSSNPNPMPVCAASYVACGGGTRCCKNLVKNGNFEGDADEWSGWHAPNPPLEQSSCVVIKQPSGNKVAELSTPDALSTSCFIAQEPTVPRLASTTPPSTKVTLSFSFKGAKPSNGAILAIDFGSERVYAGACPATFTTKTIDLTRYAGQAQFLTLRAIGGSALDTCEVDDIALITE